MWHNIHNDPPPENATVLVRHHDMPGDLDVVIVHDGMFVSAEGYEAEHTVDEWKHLPHQHILYNTLGFPQRKP